MAESTSAATSELSHRGQKTISEDHEIKQSMSRDDPKALPPHNILPRKWTYTFHSHTMKYVESCSKPCYKNFDQGHSPWKRKRRCQLYGIIFSKARAQAQPSNKFCSYKTRKPSQFAMPLPHSITWQFASCKFCSLAT